MTEPKLNRPLLRRNVEQRVSYLLVDAKIHDGIRSRGYPERLLHLELIQRGAPCYLVMCQPVERTWDKRTIKTFDDHFLFLGGEMVDLKGINTPWPDTMMTWIRSAGKVPVESVIQ